MSTTQRYSLVKFGRTASWRITEVILILCLAAGLGASARADDAWSEKPLAPRSVPRGKTMFTPMSSAETGIVTENAYADPKMWAEHYQELVYGAIGTGVAIGDYDGDGRPDIFVVSKTGQCRLFRNLGDWKFKDVTEEAGLASPTGAWDQSVAWMKRALGKASANDDPEAWKQGATFADVNNDGRLDLYVCRFGAPNLLYINQGNGTFKEEAAARGLAVTDASGMAAFCDYDRDGWLDVYVQTNMLDATAHPSGQRDYLFHNNGDGTFTNVTDRAGIKGETSGHSATWWDYDNDGWPDLYVANDYAVPDALYHNNRDGTFSDVARQVLPHTPYYSMGSDLGDVNNDGLIDLYVADMAASTHEKDQRGMAGSRTRAQGRDDVTNAAPQLMRSALYLNTGTGHMMEAARLAGIAATDWTWSVRLEDMDNDGRLDLFVTNGMSREFHNADLLERIMALENQNESRRLVRASPPLAETHFAFRNLGDLRFENVAAAWGLDQKAVSFGAAFGDLDGDGDLDLVYANYESGVTVLRNDSTTGHRIEVALRGTKSNRFGIGATVRIETVAGVQVRSLVLARGYLSSSEPLVHFGLGDMTQIDRLTVSWPSGYVQTLRNLAVDRVFTVIEPAAGAVEKGVKVGENTGQFVDVSAKAGVDLPSAGGAHPAKDLQPLLPLRMRGEGPAVAVSDLDGDGREDLVLGGTQKDPVRVLFSAADGNFRERILSLPNGEKIFGDGPVLAFAANGDGAIDLLLSNTGPTALGGSAERPLLLMVNDGHGGFAPAGRDAVPATPVAVGALAAGDFNRDGKLDVFVGARDGPFVSPQSRKSMLLVRRDGTWVDVTDEIAPGLRTVGSVTSALWTDVDGDGWLDLLVAVEWGSITYFHNDQGKRFTNLTENAGFATGGTGWWTSLAGADFNGDGRIDYVVGNYGLNTPYTATADAPTLVYFGDFGSSGPPFAIEAYYENGQIFPRLTRKELAAKIPSVLRKFLQNDAYARATLAEIVGEAKLAKAQRFAATELRSGVFLSQPNGTYRFEPLSRLAQISPTQGIAAGDFDGDGKADIYLVQNSYATGTSVGPLDGGLSLFLHGDGHGHFTPIMPAESGLVVPGDAKGLSVLDANDDGWPDFVVTRNGSTALLFQNRGVAQRKSLHIVLRGKTGNPSAIGSKLTLEMSDGTMQTAEVYSGAGYMSQSSPSCFFGYTDANRPRRIHVCWPSGESTQTEILEGRAMITVSASGGE